ncbi:MAG: hypothetical protein ACR2PL_18695 [Dehalococcoidia bacterium]
MRAKPSGAAARHAGSDSILTSRKILWDTRLALARSGLAQDFFTMRDGAVEPAGSGCD